MGTRVALIYAMLVAVIGLALVGCATAPSGSAMAPSSAATSQAALLAQAGFTLRTADTPKKLAYINSIPPQKVVQHNYQGKTLYVVCQDPSTKQCYVGDEAAYQRYQDLALQAKISTEQHDRLRAALGPRGFADVGRFPGRRPLESKGWGLERWWHPSRPSFPGRSLPRRSAKSASVLPALLTCASPVIIII